MDERPQGLTKYAEYVESYREAVEQKEILLKQKDTVEHIYSVLRFNNVKVSMDEGVQLDLLEAKARDLVSEKLASGQEFMEATRDAMTEENVAKCKRVEEDMQQVH